MMAELDRIASGISYYDEIEKCSFARCDCTGGCTDDCYDCSKDSGNLY